MIAPASPSRALVAAAFDYPSGHVVATHRHASSQFLYASHGHLVVSTDEGSWSLSPRHALWLPAGIDHRVQAVGPVAMRTAYADDRALESLPRRACVLEVSPLLRELICKAVAISGCAPAAPGSRLLGVLEDEIRAAPIARVPLPSLRDERARGIASALIANPADRRTLGQWAASTAASARTVARLFHKETGLSFGAWRERVRLLRALELLEAGRPVKSIAFAVGYDSPGAFVAMFRREMGTTPGTWRGEKWKRLD